MSSSDDPNGDRAPLLVIGLIPNLLSLARLVMGLAFPWVPVSWRVAVVVAAAASDLIDGAASRWLRVTSTAGRIIDPIADKVFALSVLTTLVLDNQLAFWQALLVITRDLAVLAGASWVSIRDGFGAVKTMPPSWLGKITTALQAVLILSVLLLQFVPWLVFVPTALCSVAAAIDYLRRY